MNLKHKNSLKIFNINRSLKAVLIIKLNSNMQQIMLIKFILNKLMLSRKLK